MSTKDSAGEENSAEDKPSHAEDKENPTPSTSPGLILPTGKEDAALSSIDNQQSHLVPFRLGKCESWESWESYLASARAIPGFPHHHEFLNEVLHLLTTPDIGTNVDGTLIKKNYQPNCTPGTPALETNEKVIPVDSPSRASNVINSVAVKAEWQAGLATTGRGWLRIMYPLKKDYPICCPNPPLEAKGSIANPADYIMTWHQDTHLVRRFFPNIDRQFVGPLCVTRSYIWSNLKIMKKVDCSAKDWDDMRLFDAYPLSSLHLLSPWDNDDSTTSNSVMKQLAKYEIPKEKDFPEQLFFREKLFLTTRHRVLVGFLHTQQLGPLPFQVHTTKSRFGKHVLRMKKLLDKDEKTDGLLPNLTTLMGICTFGASFFVTAINGEFKSDHMLSFVQFKILSRGMAWINFVGTSASPPTQAKFGSRLPFLDSNAKFRGIGLCLFLLKLVQLHMCFQGHEPTLFVKVKNGTDLYLYFIHIGFKNATLDEERAVLLYKERSTDR